MPITGVVARMSQSMTFRDIHPKCVLQTSKDRKTFNDW